MLCRKCSACGASILPHNLISRYDNARRIITCPKCEADIVRFSRIKAWPLFGVLLGIILSKIIIDMAGLDLMGRLIIYGSMLCFCYTLIYYFIPFEKSIEK